MGSVERARNLIHKGNEENLFSGKDQHRWKGRTTWLHIIFNKSLFIFGLGLKQNETFLRWLLIERKKYFKRFPDREKKGWYIDTKLNIKNDMGKRIFLKYAGFEIIDVESYNDIYRHIWE
jgi:hypothetical protein